MTIERSHTQGTARVTPTFMPLLKVACRSLIACAIAALCSAANAAETRLLVPITAFGVPGAYNSAWTTDLWAYNRSDQPLGIFPIAVSEWYLGGGGTTRIPVFSPVPPNPGQFLVVPSDRAADVQFDLRLYETKGARAPWGTKLPVVRENQFRRSVVLFNLPLAATTHRTMLRVYSLSQDRSRSEVVKIQILSRGGVSVAAFELTLTPGGPTTPGYAVALLDDFLRPEGPFQLELAGVDPSTRLWAFVSMTSNDSQEISLFTPD